MAISDDSMIYCTRKTSKANDTNTKKTSQSLKCYSVDVCKEALEKVSTPIYDSFPNPDIVYGDRLI